MVVADLLMWTLATIGTLLLVIAFVGLVVPIAIEVVRLKRQQHLDNAVWDDPWDLYDRDDGEE
jgi:hypothetical protein